MATTNVPIEIVLQDPNNPIVPDIPGGDSGDNTNILVPDTATGIGYTTKDSNSNNGINNIFGGSNATVSIASIVVLVLTLGAIVTIIIRKYQKHKKGIIAHTSKKEKLTTVASSTLAILATAVLVGNLVIPTTNATTEETDTTLNTPEKIQIVANRYEDVTIVASSKVISYASTDTSFGYKIFMSMAGDNANLYLDGDTESEYYFAPTTRAGLVINSWGYNFDGEADYTAMPLVDDPLMAQQDTSAVEGDEFTVYYTMKADKDMPFGVYSGEIAYDMKGYNGFPETLTTMQGMTSDICAAVYTPNAFKDDGVTMEDNVPTKTLTDTRDGKTYTVSKLADGKCWMVQNLDLQAEDIKQGVTLSSENTDNPAANFALPTSQTSGNDSWDSSSNQTDVETTHVYDIAASGTTYKYCYNYIGYCADEGDEIPAAELGNLYNWYTATAGTGTYDMDNSGNKQAIGSLCPRGWRLANNSTNSEPKDYSNLLYTYGIIKSATDSTYIGADKTAIYKVPLSLVPTGEYTQQGLGKVGLIGRLWLSSAYENTGAWYFSFSSGSTSPYQRNGRNYGYAVRCVAR